jgi:hypothetical protein
MAKKNSGNTEYALIMWWLLVNALGMVFVFIAWKSGWVSDIIALDSLYISRAIIIFSVIALAGCTVKIWKTSRELNVAQSYVRHIESGDKESQLAIESGTSLVAGFIADTKGLEGNDRRDMGEIFADNIGIWITSVAYNIGRLAALGFIGTLVGIAIALKVFEIPLTDSTQVLALFNKVPPGLRIAVYPALLGGIGALWLDFQFQILDEGTQKLISWVKKAGVYHATQQST